MKQIYKLEGPFYDIKVKFVDRKYLNRKFKKEIKEGESIDGLYEGVSNTIYLAKELDDQDKIQVLFHEWYHAFLNQCLVHELGEEPMCDIFGKLARTLFNVENVEEVLK